MTVTYDQEQLRLMQEMCILVDSQDKEIGPVTKKECHLMENLPGMLHRAFSCFIFSPDGKLLLQKRADEKITFPNTWTNTCCSHPLFVDQEMESENQIGCKRAVVRKLNHELGISGIDKEELQFLTRIHYFAPSNDVWGEHEIDYIFIYQGHVEVNLNSNEVSEIKYVTASELKDLFAEADKGLVQITPWFKLIVETFLYNWWDKLDDLSSFKDEKIHRLD